MPKNFSLILRDAVLNIQKKSLVRLHAVTLRLVEKFLFHLLISRKHVFKVSEKKDSNVLSWLLLASPANNHLLVITEINVRNHYIINTDKQGQKTKRASSSQISYLKHFITKFGNPILKLKSQPHRMKDENRVLLYNLVLINK